MTATYPKQTAAEIITDFELQVNDVTELSSTEELDLLNEKYQDICNKKEWEFLRTFVAGTMSSDSVGYYITPPDDFGTLAQNNAYTDNSIGIENNAAPKGVFVFNSSGTQTFVQMINFADRRQYVNRGNFCYYDVGNNKIRFTGNPGSTSYEFDYIKVPPQLALADYPVFPGRFHKMLKYAMAIDNDILQLSPKATSYQQENAGKLEEKLSDMEFWNSGLILN